MIRRVVLTPRALADVDDASVWYDKQRQGLGAKFRTFLDRTIERIIRTPEMFEVVHEGVRRAILRRFPFCVYFRVEGSRVVVLGVIHTSRSDEVWRSRIEDN